MNRVIYSALRNLIPVATMDNKVVQTLATGVFNHLCKEGWALHKYFLFYDDN